jgi:hypothetical protein
MRFLWASGFLRFDFNLLKPDYNSPPRLRGNKEAHDLQSPPIQMGRQNEAFPIEWRFDSSHALNHPYLVECPPQLERSAQRPLITRAWKLRYRNSSSHSQSAS